MQTRDMSVSNKRSNDNLSVIKSTLIENNKSLIRRMAESKSTSKERSKNRTKGTKNIDKHKNPTISIKRSNVNFINKVYYNNQENVGDQTSSITPTSWISKNPNVLSQIDNILINENSQPYASEISSKAGKSSGHTKSSILFKPKNTSKFTYERENELNSRRQDQKSRQYVTNHVRENSGIIKKVNLSKSNNTRYTNHNVTR